MTQRTDRVDELLRQEIAAILAREIGDPRIGFATITDVETTPDLRHARVWVSVIGQPDERQETLRALGRAMPFVRHQLGERLRLRRIPELHLKEDDTAERGTRVLRLLAELEAGEDPTAPPAAESLPTPVPRLPREGETPHEPGEERAAEPAAEPEAAPRARRDRRRGDRPARPGWRSGGRGGPDPRSRGKQR